MLAMGVGYSAGDMLAICRGRIAEISDGGGARGVWPQPSVEGRPPEWASDTVPTPFAQAERSARREQSELARLQQQRAALWSAINVASSRLEELQHVGETLRDVGMPGLRRLLGTRRLSRPMHSHLERLVAASFY